MSRNALAGTENGSQVRPFCMADPWLRQLLTRSEFRERVWSRGGDFSVCESLLLGFCEPRGPDFPAIAAKGEHLASRCGAKIDTLSKWVGAVERLAI
jgi:hypothetical protein